MGCLILLLFMIPQLAEVTRQEMQVRAYVEAAKHFVIEHNEEFKRDYLRFLESEREYFTALQRDAVVLDLNRNQGAERGEIKKRMERQAREVSRSLEVLTKRWQRIREAIRKLP